MAPMEPSSLVYKKGISHRDRHEVTPSSGGVGRPRPWPLLGVPSSSSAPAQRHFLQEARLTPGEHGGLLSAHSNGTLFRKDRKDPMSACRLDVKSSRPGVLLFWDLPSASFSPSGWACVCGSVGGPVGLEAHSCEPVRTTGPGFCRPLGFLWRQTPEPQAGSLATQGVPGHGASAVGDETITEAFLWTGHLRTTIVGREQGGRSCPHPGKGVPKPPRVTPCLPLGTSPAGAKAAGLMTAALGSEKGGWV